MKDFKWVAPIVILVSALPITLNFVINGYFEKLDNKLAAEKKQREIAQYYEKKARIESRRFAENMFPGLVTPGLLHLESVN
ncbi:MULTISPECIES: hypothetical protein [Motilimonas]|uniref:Uncharacterized protein n=1 Tax=Motilimonas cestriensis TaxID=2742685 RepID=A0ABS8W5A2_9GAMM|nr:MULTISPECIES: hypothetical protein [Motilimonas]MCE0556644.1 hypothetical protein [Motilimonas sp. E26]MCE2594149.1 hypothetical protein [Motilimonas cestriensis]MDO6524789.1 hypothetical protein [Motilimonas sp. 1_MG-2023]